jgi:predicted metalloprotease with PDZ domain
MSDSKSLDDVRRDLYRAFNKAMKGVDYWDANKTSEAEVNGLTASASAAAQTAQSIALVEHEIAVMKLLQEAKESGSGITIEIDKGLARSVSVPSPIKLKAP